MISRPARAIDTHVHVWDYDSPWMAWLVDRPASWDVIRRDFRWSDLRAALDTADVDELILMQACTTPAETRMLLDVASGQPCVRGVVGWATLTSPQATERDLTSFEGPGSNKLVGIRNNHQWAPDQDVIATPAAIESCRLLAERNLALDLHFPDYRTLPLAQKLAETVSEGRYIIDHLGKPAITDPEAFRPWAEAMSQLSMLPNVYIKYSGWATFLGRTKASDVKPYIEFALEKFGPGRIMFAGNWPVALVAGSYRDTYDASLEAIAGLTATELDRIFYDTAVNCYLRPR